MNIEIKDTLKRVGLFFSGVLVFQLAAILLSIFGLSYVIFITLGECQISSVQMFLAYLIGLVICLLIFGRDSIKEFACSIKKPKNIRDGITLVVIILCINIIYNIIVNAIHPITNNTNELSVDRIIVYNPYLSFFTVVIFAPILEEITYRFALFGSLKKINKILAYCVSIAIFALIHFDFTASGEKLVIELLNLPAYLVAAGVLSYAYDRGGLGCSVAAHAFNNFLSYVMTLLSFYL